MVLFLWEVSLLAIFVTFLIMFLVLIIVYCCCYVPREVVVEDYYYPEEYIEYRVTEYQTHDQPYSPQGYYPRYPANNGPTGGQYQVSGQYLRSPYQAYPQQGPPPQYQNSPTFRSPPVARLVQRDAKL